MFDLHSLNALVGSEFITNYGSGINASRRRYEYDTEKFRYIDFGSTEQDLWNGGSGSEWALMSYFTSLTYVYDMRYMLTANFRQMLLRGLQKKTGGDTSLLCQPAGNCLKSNL